jgi:hypothetical protein
MRSKDGGDTWKMLDQFPQNYYVTAILQPTKDVLLVAAQSHLYDRNEGGIWRSTNDGATFEKVSSQPTFNLMTVGASKDKIIATHTRSAAESVSISANEGRVFQSFGKVPWAEGATPFYTCGTELADGKIIFAGLTRLEGGLPNNTDSQFFIRESSATSEEWKSFPQPTSMDEDSMPKDRMAVLGDPDHADLMYVAGNAGALAWRVNVTSKKWVKMWDKPDVVDGTEPHGDCRNYAWDSTSNDDGRLVLVSDGGIFARELPRQAGGRWVSLNSDYASMELLSAHYDYRNDRYVIGAQDNSAQVSPINTTSKDASIGFVEGDGTVTMVDSAANPSRLYGTTQFLGVGTIDIDPTVDANAGDGDDDEDCGGLCFVQGNKFIEVPVNKYFREPSSFPYFVHPYTLNRLDPTKLHFWTNGTATRPSAFYEFSIPYTVKDKDDIKAPTKLLESPPEAMFLDFVSGGYTNGTADPDLLMGVSNSHLYIRSKDTINANADVATMTKRILPAKFADPVTLEYDNGNKGARILGPVTHGRTISLAMSPSDSRVLVVTGWPSVSSNLGDESVFASIDAGQTWLNITGNLKSAAGVVGKVRPGGVLIVDLLKNGRTRAILVGTSSGVLVSFISGEAADDHDPSTHKWTRFGNCDEFPIVLTAALDYEPFSDRLVAATFGRGVYVLKDAKRKLLDARDALTTIDDGEGVVPVRVPEESSAKYFAQPEL